MKTFWRADATSQRKIGSLAPNECKVGKAFLAGVPVEPVHVTDRTALERVRAFAEHDQFACVRIRQRPQQHRIDNAEDGSVRSDPEGKREDRDDRDARIFQKQSKRVTNIVQHVISLRGLFVTKRRHWIHTRGATRGNETGNCRDNRE